MRLMLAWADEDQAKHEKVAIAPGEYPGSPPNAADVARAEHLRQEGNTAYGDGRLEEAVRLYSGSALLNPSDHLVYSNRSACWLRLGRPIEALDDAELCVKLAPDFARGFLRKGMAEQMLNRRVDAQASYKRGLGYDPGSATLLNSLNGLRAEAGGGLQATLYHVLFVSPHLQMDRLFRVLEDPDRLTGAYVEQHKAELDAQFECLTQTLRVDLGLLLASPVLRDAYDRVTFACGQLLQWAPEAVSRHLCQAPRIVEGLGLALRCGWKIHHGVAKFSANALTILATSEGACDNLRREAVRLLLGGMLRWLLNPATEPEDPPEDRDVCGCTFLSPRLSAATWLERLFEHGTRPWVREECERFPGVVPLVVHLCLVVRDERAVPLGLPCLLRLPAVAKAVMECEAIVDLSTCNRDPSGRRDGRHWLNRKGKAGHGKGHAAPASSTEKSVSTATPASANSGEPASADAASPQVRPLPAPAQRLGEWIMASLGYLLVFVDDDALFAAHACSALHRLAVSVPNGVARLTESLWMGLPMLERLSMLSCQHTAGLELLETLARHSSSSRVAMCSLASALAGAPAAQAPGDVRPEAALAEAVPMEVETEEPLHAVPAETPDGPADREGGRPDDGGAGRGDDADPAGRDGPAVPVPTPPAGAADVESASSIVPFTSGATGATTEGASGSTSGGNSAALAGQEEGQGADHEHEHEHEHDGLGEPSWVECYHELSDELWVDPVANAAGQEPDPPADGLRPTSLDIVMLGNFSESASQVPVAGRLLISGPDEPLPDIPDPDAMELDADGAAAEENRKGGRTTACEVTAVPAVWNTRYADGVQAPLAMDEANELGSPEWQQSRLESAAVLLLRSMIQRSPATPDWAAAVWLCADAGAKAAVVVNDLPDDGPAQPAFRMGLFGSPAPPIPAFMVSGKDGDVVRAMARQASPRLIGISAVSIRSGGASLTPGFHLAPGRPRSGGSQPEGVEPSGAEVGEAEVPAPEAGAPPPPWPLVLRMPQDVAQAWSLIETVHRAAPSPALASAISTLAERMRLPEKRVWLTRRLQRYHRGDTDTDEPVEPHLAFVECDREGEQLIQLRQQLVERVGLASSDIAGEFEVRFRDESSVGSAVMREWMDLQAQQAFLKPANRLLVSYDRGATFLPDPAAPFVNAQWKGDFEMLGRLLGLALWHQVTLDLPMHPYICELLLHDGEPPAAAPNMEEDAEQLQQIDEELHRHKVQWLLANDVSALGFEMPFTDVLASSPAAVEPSAPPEHSRSGDGGNDSGSGSESSGGSSGSSSSSSSSTSSPLPPLPEVVAPSDALLGDVQTTSDSVRLRPASHVEVALVPGGEDLVVTEENKREFVQALLDWRLRTSLRGPVEAMLCGLRAAVPSAVLAEARRMLAPGEVHALLAGSRDIDAEDWERNTRTVGGLTSSSQEVRWFWRTVRQWAADGRQDRLQDLLQFATGSRRVPVGGFAQLVGFNGGRHLFTLAKGVHLSAKSLPTSHACICTLDLPPWESFEAAQQKLLAAVEAGRSRFDEGTTARGGDAADAD